MVSHISIAPRLFPSIVADMSSSESSSSSDSGVAMPGCLRRHRRPDPIGSLLVGAGLYHHIPDVRRRHTTQYRTVDLVSSHIRGAVPY